MPFRLSASTAQRTDRRSTGAPVFRHCVVKFCVGQQLVVVGDVVDVVVLLLRLNSSYPTAYTNFGCNFVAVLAAVHSTSATKTLCQRLRDNLPA